MDNFEEWFKTTESYKLLEAQNYFKIYLFTFIECRNQYQHSAVQIAYMTWQEQQKRIDELNLIIELRDQQLTDEIALSTKYVGKFDELQARNHKSTLILEDILKKGLIQSKYSLFDLEQTLKGGEG